MRIYILVACLWLATNPLEGKIVFYSGRDGKAEIYTMNSDGSNQTRVTRDPTAAVSPSWSPNGQQIIFDSSRGSQVEVDYNIWVIDADGGNPRQLTDHPEWDNFPDWSPDGNQIAFDSDRLSKEGEPPKTEIYVMDADGGNVKQVTDIGFASQPRWSPDGEWILFEGDIDQGRGIYAIRPDGTDMWQVSEPVPGAALYLGGWSPDGKRVLYKGTIGNVRNSFAIIVTLNKSGRVKVKRREEVPMPKMPFQTVSFGADGKSILFGGQSFGNWDIYRFRLDTHELIRLTDHYKGDLDPRERNSRLPVSPQGLTPKRWGEIKSNSHRYRGRGGISTPPVP